MNLKLWKYLEEIASRKYWGEDDESFNLTDYTGGDEETAFLGGKYAGEIQLARYILKEAFYK